MTLGQMLDSGEPLEKLEVQFRARMVRLALQREKGHCGHAARRLGIHRNTLTNILAESGTPLKTGWKSARPVKRKRRSVMVMT